jgi:hypothetical protein
VPHERGEGISINGYSRPSPIDPEVDESICYLLDVKACSIAAAVPPASDNVGGVHGASHGGNDASM